MVGKHGQHPIGMRPFGRETQIKNHVVLRPKLDNIIPMWKEGSMRFLSKCIVSESSSGLIKWVDAEQNGVIELLACGASCKKCV